MKLRDLDGRFIRNQRPDGSHQTSVEIEGAQGVIFDCPQCTEKRAGHADPDEVGVHSVAIYFSNPRNAAPSSHPSSNTWEMAGAGLDDLTLNPSIALRGPCDWHGWVKNGDAT